MNLYALEVLRPNKQPYKNRRFVFVEYGVWKDSTHERTTTTYLSVARTWLKFVAQEIPKPLRIVSFREETHFENLEE